MSRIAFIDTCNSTPHLETSLELAYIGLLHGHDVEYHFLGHKVPFEDFLQPIHRYCWLETSAEQLGARLLKHPRLRYYNGKQLTLYNPSTLPSFRSIQDLKTFEYKTYKAGLACCSSLISRIKSVEPNIWEHEQLITDILTAGISVYEYAAELFRARPFDLVYIFNGRFANSRAVLDAAKATNTNYLIHERGCDKTKYAIYQHAPHNLEKVKESILHEWASAGPDRSEVAEKYFRETREGRCIAWPSYTANQVKGLSIRRAKNRRRLFTYFSTCDDEFAAIEDGVRWSTWKSQTHALSDLLVLIGKQHDSELAIRLHPHLAHKNARDLKAWLSLPLPDNAFIIMPEDPVDTYSLIQDSDAVLSSGSTVGIEAVFWGTPSICLGPCLYDHLGAVYSPDTSEELAALLSDNQLVCQTDKALPYGYYMATFGKPYRFYAPDSLFEGKFLGFNLQTDHGALRLRRSYEALNASLAATLRRIRYLVTSVTRKWVGH